MNKSKLSTIQSALVIGAIIYVVSPDLLFGPFDDAAVATIAAIAHFVLGCVKRFAPDPAPSYPADDIR